MCVTTEVMLMLIYSCPFASVSISALANGNTADDEPPEARVQLTAGSQAALLSD